MKTLENTYESHTDLRIQVGGITDYKTRIGIRYFGSTNSVCQYLYEDVYCEMYFM